jgi:hypothetical protein
MLRGLVQNERTTDKASEYERGSQDVTCEHIINGGKLFPTLIYPRRYSWQLLK